MTPRLKKFISYYRPYRLMFFGDVLCALIVAAVVLILPLIVRHVTGVILANPSPAALPDLYAAGAVMLALVAVYIVCTTYVDYQGHVMGALIESDIRTELFAHYQKLSFSFYDERNTGQLMSRITNDLFAISELAHHLPEEVLIAALKFFGSFVILMMINPTLTLAIFIFMPPMIVYAVYFNIRFNRAMARSRERIGDINAQAGETLSGIRVVQSFANESIENRKFAAANQGFLASRRDEYRNDAYLFEGLVGFAQLLTIGIIFFGGIAIANGTLTLPDLLTYLLFAAILIDPINKAANLSRLLQEGVTGFNRFMEMMEIEPDIVDAPNAVELERVNGEIEFREVCFKYREEQGYVLKDISLKVNAGEYVALVGSSGVGKTTLCSLIPRFYEATSGEILLDSVNIRHIKLRSLRQQIGVVQQDVYLFAGTVAENIRYGKPDASDDEVIAAAKLAHAHDFIMALPDGYNTNVGQRGVKLSGGQKQRLSIARVFLKDPPIIIFDEATSALDNESEKAVQASLEKLTENRTMLVIAHRLTTIRNAQRIIVLTDNGIHEQGTHDELIALEGIYANLYNMRS